MSKILAFSDCHLSADNCRNEELLKFLKQYEDDVSIDKIIICGDLVDNLQGRFKRKDWAVLSQLRRMSDKIPIYLTIGNHDVGIEPLAHLLGMEVVDFYIEDGVFYEHSHIHDKFITDRPILTWIADLIYALLQKLDKTHSLAKFIKSRSKQFLHCVDKIKEGSLKTAKNYGCEIAVNGHSHYPIQEVKYGNCGSWTESPSSYIIVNDGIIKLFFF